MTLSMLIVCFTRLFPIQVNTATYIDNLFYLPISNIGNSAIQLAACFTCLFLVQTNMTIYFPEWYIAGLQFLK